MDDLSPFCCLNEHCPDYGQRGRGNLTVPMRYGPHRRRLLRCGTCKARFSERKGTVLEQSRLPDEKVHDILDHIREGCGTRATSRLVHVDKNTVTRYIALAGGQAATLHDEFVAFSPPDPRGPGG